MPGQWCQHNTKCCTKKDFLYFCVNFWAICQKAGFWFAPGLAFVWTLVFGFGSGATMILGLTFIGLRASSAHQAAALSGMAQSIGYLLAA